MCGRFTLTLPDHRSLTEALGVTLSPANAALYRPRYNIAPSDRHWVVIDREIVPAVWGIPSRFEGRGSLINARLETAAVKPTFREAFRKRRCAVPADGFYEWKMEGKRKQPYRFRFPGRGLFLFAGLFETEPELSFTILTKEANSSVAPVHARMPVILARGTFCSWLDEARIEETGITLECHAASLRVNSPANDDPSLLEESGN